MANVTGDEVRISKNRMVGEFHPRDASVYDVVQGGEIGKGGRDYFNGAEMPQFIEGGVHSRGGAEVRTSDPDGTQSHSQLSSSDSMNNNRNINNSINSCNNNINNTESVLGRAISEVRPECHGPEPHIGPRTRPGLGGGSEEGTELPFTQEDTGLSLNEAARIGLPREGSLLSAQQECGISTGKGGSAKESTVDWAEFEKEPLKWINLKELREQRSEEEVEKLARFIVKYKHIFSDGVLDFASNPNVKHDTTARIITTEENPKIVARGQRCSPEENKIYIKTIEDKIREGVVEPSRAPWCSNALLVRKDGKIRMVVDYRALNKITVKDSYPMPRIQDVTDVLKGTHWLTGMDCVQAFHQIPMADERSKDLTTFRGPTGGVYRYRYMPMGLVNAMAIWSRFIDTAMAGMSDFVLCYADDVLVFTKSANVDDHIADLEKVFRQLEKNGIKIKAAKLKLGLKLMPFLGVVITREGMVPDKETTAAIDKLQYPKTLKELRSVLGMFAYYRRFIARFSTTLRTN